ncbi:HepT-like ribonuclease domain-containing protein [Candidatus Magnetomonas plexicatena]|uniref:HepT-like ribonuclease domain-containing protein n=1 Tax=Candidatus Magnetomonas plexicatena TaxID=2552947 RepID=UPI001C747239|nr:DUF86 domain-containing protein [Nitrospirales bacterium LBB_01]
MTNPSPLPRLTDIVEAIERIYKALGNISTFDDFKTDWQLQWIVERGVEIVSEASRHLSVELKERHPDIPWPKVAGIGNIIRHDYENVSLPIMWRLLEEYLPALEKVCRHELEVEIARRKTQQ